MIDEAIFADHHRADTLRKQLANTRTSQPPGRREHRGAKRNRLSHDTVRSAGPERGRGIAPSKLPRSADPDRRLAVVVDRHADRNGVAGRDHFARRRRAVSALRGRPPSLPLSREARAFDVLRCAPTRAARPTMSTLVRAAVERRVTRTRASGRLSGVEVTLLGKPLHVPGP